MSEEIKPSEGFTKLNGIRNILLTQIGQLIEYKDAWSKEFRMDNIDSIDESISETYYLTKEEVDELTKEELLDLGFRHFSDSKSTLLMPIWIRKFLPKDYIVHSPLVDKEKQVGEIDNDHRYGLLAYGLKR